MAEQLPPPPVPAERRPLSKRVRFDVFKRDGFRCSYCGRHPPDVLLECDHIVPVCEGGDDGPDNLTTACFDCNRGKGGVPLTVVPRSLADKGAEVAEREEQLAGYRAIMQARADRIEDDAWQVVKLLFPPAPGETATVRRDWLQSVKTFNGRLDLHEVKEAAEIAWARKAGGDTARFKYFCGICWSKIKAREGWDG